MARDRAGHLALPPATPERPATSRLRPEGHHRPRHLVEPGRPASDLAPESQSSKEKFRRIKILDRILAERESTPRKGDTSAPAVTDSRNRAEVLAPNSSAAMSTPLRERPDAPLGTLIFRAGLLPAETIENALEEGVKTGRRLGEILIERSLLQEEDLTRLLAGQKGLPFVSLRTEQIDPQA